MSEEEISVERKYHVRVAMQKTNVEAYAEVPPRAMKGAEIVHRCVVEDVAGQKPPPLPKDRHGAQVRLDRTRRRRGQTPAVNPFIDAKGKPDHPDYERYLEYRRKHRRSKRSRNTSERQREIER